MDRRRSWTLERATRRVAASSVAMTLALAVVSVGSTVGATTGASAAEAAGGQSAAPVLAAPPAVAGEFAGQRGCFLLEEVGGATAVSWGGPECERALSPCSTFKIPHSLIALDAGVVRADTVLPWDGSPQPFAPWRRDHTLRSAFEHSVVWYYQEVASRLGLDRLRAGLRSIDYGPISEGADPTGFWLGGQQLLVTPAQQLRLVRELVGGELPFSPAAQATVLSWMSAPDGAGGTFGGKTGTCLVDGRPGLGWYVGQARRGGRQVVFVTLLHAAPGERVMGADARRLTRRVLRRLALP